MKKYFFLFLPALLFISLQYSCFFADHKNTYFHKDVSQRLYPDDEKDSIKYLDLEKQFGKYSRPKHNYKIGVVLKFFGNQYWQLLTGGLLDKARKLNIKLEIQAGSSENDPSGQKAKMDQLIEENYDAILISPQNDDNLALSVKNARKKGILVLNINESGSENAEYFVGANHFQSGALAAEYLKKRLPENSEVAVIMGEEGAYAAKQRTRGFIETLKNSGLKLSAAGYGKWDFQASYDETLRILKENKNIKGFYGNNDNIALGIEEALIKSGNKAVVIGTDGINPAIESIKNKKLDATIDLFPRITGEILLETILRILDGQKIRRVVYIPQKIIDYSNYDKSGILNDR
jgi:ribose transport system substrate-binding protein